MQETYFYLCKESKDRLFDRVVIDWITWGPISVTTNRIGTKVYRVIGQGRIVPESYIKDILRSYPLTLLHGRAIRGDRAIPNKRRPLP